MTPVNLSLHIVPWLCHWYGDSFCPSTFYVVLIGPNLSPRLKYALNTNLSVLAFVIYEAFLSYMVALIRRQIGFLLRTKWLL